jgi:hypothetical protein
MARAYSTLVFPHTGCPWILCPRIRSGSALCLRVHPCGDSRCGHFELSCTSNLSLARDRANDGACVHKNVPESSDTTDRRNWGQLLLIVYMVDKSQRQAFTLDAMYPAM